MDQAQQVDARRIHDAQIAQQRAWYEELLSVNAESLRIYEELPRHLTDAESWLDQAERDFSEGAFAPFWGSIEQATVCLAGFNNGIASISRYHDRYKKLSQMCESKGLKFPIAVNSVNALVVATTTVFRMNSIVRKAQCNFHFASIYEQRKTNNILIAGFTSLAQAIDEMGQTISSGIEGLHGQISLMSSVMQDGFETIGGNIAQTSERIIESINQVDSTIKLSTPDMKSIEARHERALEMLDNIQRRRKPIGAPLFEKFKTEPAP